jgi:hypothetical protein
MPVTDMGTSRTAGRVGTSSPFRPRELKVRQTELLHHSTIGKRGIIRQLPFVTRCSDYGIGGASL